MKKAIGYISLVALSAIILTACSSSKKTDEQDNTIIAEYIAGSMLKYDRNYNDGLVYTVKDSETETTGSKTSTQEQIVSGKEGITSDVSEPIDNTSNSISNDTAGNTTSTTANTTDTTAVSNTTDTTVSNTTDTVTNTTSTQKQDNYKYTDLSSVFNISNLKFSSSKYTTADSYPNDANYDGFIIDSEKGNELLIVKFNIKNTSNKSMKLDLMKKEIDYTLTINGDSIKPLMTMLLNDIQFYDMKIGKGDTKQAVLLFQIPQDTSIKTLSLLVSNAKEANNIVLK
jgi:hypothetical protein